MITQLRKRVPAGCVSDLQFDEWRAGELGDSEARALEDHLQGCRRCQACAQSLDEQEATFGLRYPWRSVMGGAKPDTGERQKRNASRARSPWFWGTGLASLAAAASFALVMGGRVDLVHRDRGESTQPSASRRGFGATTGSALADKPAAPGNLGYSAQHAAPATPVPPQHAAAVSGDLIRNGERPTNSGVANGSKPLPASESSARAQTTESGARGSMTGGRETVASYRGRVTGVGPSNPAHAPSSGTRLKGDVRIGFFTSRDGRVAPGHDGETVFSGDKLRFLVTTPRPRHLAILSRDGQGAVFEYFPGGGRSRLVPTTKNLALGSSVELDGNLGKESLWGVFCDAPFSTGPLLTSLRQSGAVPELSGCSIDRLDIVKQGAP